MNAIKVILAAHRSTDVHVSTDQAQAAWDEFALVRRLLDAYSRLLEMQERGLPDQAILARRDIQELRSALEF